MTGVTGQLIPGPAGSLQVLAEFPSASDDGAVIAIVCHPHPLHGGTLSNKVVHQLARAFRGLGAISIRFNFRGVGESDGQYDEGRGELDDLLTVVAWAKDRWPNHGLWLAGFSFGGLIALKGARQLSPDWLVTVAPAINYFPTDALQERDFPWLLVHGDHDEIVPTETLLGWFRGLEHQPRLELLEGAGHFFHGRLNELKQVIVAAGQELLPGGAQTHGKLKDR